MSVEETLNTYDLFDNAIVRHGFTAYMRDYEIVAELFYGEHRGVFTYLFRGCVEAHYESSIPGGAFSMDDVLLDLERGQPEGGPDVFMWGVNHANAYPGWTYDAGSERTAAWSKKTGLPMHEVVIETNVYKLSLVFYSLVVEKGGAIGAGMRGK